MTSTKLLLFLSLVNHLHNYKNGKKIKIKAIIIINFNPLIKIFGGNCLDKKRTSCVL